MSTNSTYSQVIRLPEVIKRSGLSRSLIYEKISPKSRWYDEGFPKPFKLSVMANGWDADQLERWIQSRIKRN